LIKKIYFKIELLLSFIGKNWPYLLIGIVAGIMLFIYKKAIYSTYIKNTQKVQYAGIEGLYTTKNLPENISNKLSYGLTYQTENNKPELSQIVESLDIQDDNKEYVFNLKDNLFWHDGKKVKASDIKIDIEGVNVSYQNEEQFIIRLEKPYSPILSLLSKPIFKKNLVGMGQYKLTRVKYKDGYIQNIRLKNTNGNEGPLEFKFYQNESELTDAFRLGEVDQIEVSQIPKEIEEQNGLTINQRVDTETKYIAVFLNTEKLSNKSTRQALAYSTPKSQNKNERCLGPISANSWAYNPNIKEYNYSPERSKELFKDSGIETIDLTVLDRKLLPYAESISKAWEENLKIKVHINITSQINSDYDALLTFGGIPDDPDQYIYWHSTQKNTNITHLNNSRIDKLLEEGRLTSDTIERKQIYLDFQRYLLEESPAIFISYPTYYHISR